MELRPLIVALEDPGAEVGRDAGALVRHLDHRLVADDAGAQGDRAAAVHQGVLDQRGQYLGDRARRADGLQMPACPELTMARPALR